MRVLFIILVLPVLAIAQDFEFEQEWDSIQIGVDSLSLNVPWTGGYKRSSPEFCDIDGDDVMDLFVGRSLGTITFYKNIGSIYNAIFQLSYSFSRKLSHNFFKTCTSGQ